MFGDGKPDDRLPELLGESSEAASYTRIRLILAFWPLKVAELVEAEIEAVRHGSKIRFKRQESPTITSNARKHQHTRFENGKLLRAELKKIFEGFECVKKCGEWCTYTLQWHTVQAVAYFHRQRASRQRTLL